MALFLVQHGKSSPKEVDPERGLTTDGHKDVERIASVAKGYQVQVATIRHSGKKRAQQTAEVIATLLSPSGGIEVGDGLAPLDDVTAMADTLDPAANLMLVGHLPFMERLTAYLVTGSADRPIFKFQNGGIVCLDRIEEPGGWIIKWALQPEIG